MSARRFPPPWSLKTSARLLLSATLPVRDLPTSIMRMSRSGDPRQHREVARARVDAANATVPTREPPQRCLAVPRCLRVQPTQEGNNMRKLALALVAAITVGTAAPAIAQVGFY